MRLPTPADASRGVVGQYARLAAAVATLPAESYALPTRLGEWSVAELVAHLASTGDAVPRALARPAPGKAEAGLFDYLLKMRTVAGAVAQRAADNAAGVAPADLTARVAAVAAEIRTSLAGTDPARLVLVRLGAMPLGDFLVTRCVEGVVHGLDLAAATGADVTPDPVALGVVVRTFAALLVHVAPGRSVEVRVPGHVAVQCVEGPRHTRGTPPNVVETSAETFVELCAGRLSWADAVATGGVRASGERADLSAYVPLIG